MKIAVFGAGGVGGYFGGQLSRAGAEVHLVARGEHLRALNEPGLRVHSPLGDLHIQVPSTDKPEQIGRCDFVLFCVKSFETEAATAGLPPLLGPETAVVSLQNGIDNEEKIAAAVGAPRVIGGAAFILATVSEPGVIMHVGNVARIVFGELDGARSDRSARLLQAFRSAGVDATLAGNIRSVLWSKFAFICAQAGLTAVTGLPIGKIRSVPETWDLFERLAREVCDLAEAEGVTLPSDTVAKHLDFARELDPQCFSSLFHDMRAGKRMELEALHGTVVRRAESHGLSVPMNQTIYALLRPWALKNKS